MTRQQSQSIKGIAILFMLIYHLFNLQKNVEICTSLIDIAGIPLCSWLARCTHPVAFFLILGGYGMYKVYEKGDRHRWFRIGKLYIHYWLTLIIFIGISLLKNQDVWHYYLGNPIKILQNITGEECTYNGEMWFLLPYVILSLLSPYLFKWLRNVSWVWIIGFTFLINLCTSYTISRHGPFWFSHYYVYDILLMLHLSMAFFVGAMCARGHFFEKMETKAVIKENKGKLWFQCGALVTILTLMTLMCLFKYFYFYAFFMIVAFTLLKIPGWLNTVLGKLGNQSMNMWMIHTWFCYYVFHDFIYSFSYPILIFLVLTVVSYYSGVIIDIIAKPIERLFMTPKEIKAKPVL